jgi:hypothetical protein
MGNERATITSPLGIQYTLGPSEHAADAYCPIDGTQLVVKNYGDAHHGADWQHVCIACKTAYGHDTDSGSLAEIARAKLAEIQLELARKKALVTRLERIVQAAEKNGFR